MAYAKYFGGVDKVAPVRFRDKMERQLRTLERLPIRSTVLRFKLGGLRSRFVVYKHYWSRVEHELERGASRRDLLRLRARLGAGGFEPPEPPDMTAESPPSEGSALVQVHPDGEPPPPANSVDPSANGTHRAVPPPPLTKRPAPEQARRQLMSVQEGLDPKHMRDVFSALVKAKRAAGESLEGLTYAAMCRKLARETPKLKERHNCAEVRFEVSTVGGKVRLRARPHLGRPEP